MHMYREGTWDCWALFTMFAAALVCLGFKVIQFQLYCFYWYSTIVGEESSFIFTIEELHTLTMKMFLNSLSLHASKVLDKVSTVVLLITVSSVDGCRHKISLCNLNKLNDRFNAAVLSFYVFRALQFIVFSIIYNY